MGPPDLIAMMAFSHSNYGNTSITLSCFWISVETSQVRHPFTWRPELPHIPSISCGWLPPLFHVLHTPLPPPRIKFPSISHGLLETGEYLLLHGVHLHPQKKTQKGLLRP